MWKNLNTELKVIFSIWLVALHLMLGGLVFFVVTCNARIDQTGGTPVPLTPLQIAATAEAKERATAVALAPEGTIRPCVIRSAGQIDPCAPRRSFGFQRVNQLSPVYPDDPPTYEQVLLNSYGLYSREDIPEAVLSGSAHLVVRGKFDSGRTRCADHPLLFPAWVLGDDAKSTGASVGSVSSDDLTSHHLTCFMEFSVHEYLAGRGPSKLNVQLPTAGVPYDTSDAPALEASAEEVESLRSQVADEYEGIEWVAWLGPSYNVLVESLTAYALWDVQKDDDDEVRVVSPDAAYYEDSGVTGSALDRLRAPLAEFRRDIKVADANRGIRTNSRVGVGTNMPKLVTHVFKLPDYYEEIGAYDNPIATPAPPPTPPYPPTDLSRWHRTDPPPEVDLAWTAPVSSEVTHYKVVRVDNLGTETIIADGIPAESPEYTDSDLPIAGAKYTYTVNAVNAYGESAPSDVAVIWNGVPNAPTGVYATLKPGNEAELAWTAPPSSYVTHYRVERKIENNRWLTIEQSQSIPAEYLSTTDRRPLRSGKTYAYRVVAFNEWSESTPSEPYELRVP